MNAMRIVYHFLTAILFAALTNQAAVKVKRRPVPASAVNHAGSVNVSLDYGKLPLAFEPNMGQTDERVHFIARGDGMTAFFTDIGTTIVLSRDRRSERPDGIGRRGLPAGKAEQAVVGMKLAGAAPPRRVAGIEKVPGTSNYFIGNDPANWHTDVPHYGRIQYEGVYPGVDLVWYGNQRRLEYDFVVRPGADPKQIEVAYEGVESLRVEANGDLVLRTALGEVRQQKPKVYQEIAGQRVEVGAQYSVVAGHRVSFALARYDRKQELRIDPLVLIYSTYLGGSYWDQGYGIAADGEGSAYVTGRTLSTNFPVQLPYQATLPDPSGQAAFVTKFTPAGNALVYSTYLGGSGGAIGNAITVDAAGSAYVTGETAQGFPTQSPLYPDQTAIQGGFNVFLTKLAPAGDSLVYSTYLGGSAATGIAVDGAGSAYITGFTKWSNLPIQSAFQAKLAGTQNAFVTKLNPAGSALVYSTYLGGNDVDAGYGIAVDAAGSAYVTGSTGSSNFPTQSPYQTYQGGGDAFVTKLSTDGSMLVYSTFLGGGGTQGSALAVDGAGAAYVTGSTSSTAFPVVSAFQPILQSSSGNAFVTKINPAGSALVYSTYLGGSGSSGGDHGTGIAVNGAGSAYVTGSTTSSDFPTQFSYQTFQGAVDAFVTKLAPTGNALVYSSLLGGNSTYAGVGVGRAYGAAMAVDQSGSAYVAGSTTAIDFPVTPSAFQTTGVLQGGYNAFVTKLAFLTITKTQGDNQSATLGATFPQNLQVTITNDSGSPVPNLTVAFMAPSTGAGGTFAGGVNTAVTNASGVATAAAFTANSTTGSYQVLASVGTGSVAFSLTNTPVPASITATGGTPQSAVIGKQFATQLQATVTASNASPVSGATVTFTAPSSGASATFSSPTAITNSSGVATVTATANNEAGSYSVSAGVRGVTTAASFSLTNTAAAAASLTISGGNNQNAARYTAFAQNLQVTAKDSGGNPVSNVTVTFTAPSTGASGTFSGGVNTAVTNAAGVATAAIFTANNTFGSYQVKTSAPGVTAVAFTLTNTVGDPALIGFWSGNYTAADSSVVGNNSIFSGSYVQGSPGRFGGAFNLSTGTVTIPDNVAYNSFHSYPGWTVGFWFNTNGIQPNSTNDLFLGQDNGAGYQPKWFIDYGYTVYGANDNFVWHVNDSNEERIFLLSAPVSPLPSGWNQLTVVTDNVGKSVAFYLNGQPIGTDNLPSYVLETTANLVLGGAEGFTYTGLMSDVAIFKRALLPQEVMDLVGFTVGPFPPIIEATTGTPQSATIGDQFVTPLQAMVTEGGSPVSGAKVTFTAPSSGASAKLSSSTATTNSSGVASVTATANATVGSYSVTANVTGASTPASFSLTNNMSAGPPTVVSLSPNSGSGTEQTFKGVYSDPNGAADLGTLGLLLNTAVNGVDACYVLYYPATNLIYLKNNADTGLSAGITPGSTGSASNSQCTLTGTGSSYSASGTTATLTVALTFTGTFITPTNVYLYASETNTTASNSGWVKMGTWGVSAGLPTVVSLSPSSGSGAAQTFKGAYSDPNGATDLSTVRLLFNTAVNGVDACYVLYYPATNFLYLENNADTGLSAGVTPGSTGSASNSQCTLAGTGSSYSASGTTATLTVALTFTGTFVTPTNVYLYASEANTSASTSGWVKAGSWTP